MKFKEYKIKEICDIKSGKRLPNGSDFSIEKTNYPYIRARDIKNGKINDKQLAYIDEKTHCRIKRYIINESDVAITIVANIGDVGYCERKLDGVNLTENAVRLTNFIKNINSRYLTYYLSQPFVKEYMENLAAGAAQSKLGIYKIQRIKVVLPELEYQNNVVSTISKYDDLIEKNNRKIAILEEQIQELYKEWFVRFRFPGYEKAEFVNGLPKGWNINRIGECCENVLVGGDAPNDFSEERTEEYKYPIYSNGIVNDGLYGYSKIYKVTKPSVTVSARGTVGFVCLRNVEYTPIVRLISLIPKDYIKPVYFYQALKYVDLGGNGTSQQQLTAPMIMKRKILLADQNMVGMFDNITKKIFNAINKLKDNNDNISRTRDLLLPRLMSGKLEVKG